MAGDSVLAEFGTATGAVTASLAVQAALEASHANVPIDRRMRVRIGVHLGDVIEKADGSIYGDGVNIAARLEGLAEPGGIMVSESIHIAVRGKVHAAFADCGEQTVKNIPHAVRVYQVHAADVVPAPPEVGALLDRPVAAGEMDLSLPNKPSIAVLPFANMSGDPEQEYFTDGITEDIITELTRFHQLFVIARNSSFTYKGKAVDVRTVAKELGVRYVLEGSIRRAGNRIRVTGQLIDAVSGTHLWAEKYDRNLDDVFVVQEELTRSIVVAIAPQIEAAENEKIRRRLPESLSAYEIAVRANAKAMEGWIRTDAAMLEEAISDARRALAIDSRSTLGLYAIALAHWSQLVFGFANDRESARQAGLAAATKLVEVDHTQGRGYAVKGILHVYSPARDRIDEALIDERRALELNPNDTTILTFAGSAEILAGHADKGLEHLQRGLRASPRDPLIYNFKHLMAMACCCTREYARGVEYGLDGIADAPGYGLLHAYLAVNHVGLGDLTRARADLEAARRFSPKFVERALAGNLVFYNPDHLRRITTFIRIAAGLEEPSAAAALR